MSLTDSGILQKQETGVTYETPYFGPATGKHYDDEKWALTVPEASTQEILLNPEPPDRRRTPGAPAFLKPSSSSIFLPALIKILHEIPMAREALLNRSHTLNNYGQENDWWDGTPIRGLRVVNVDDSLQDLPLDDIIYESQRLMAFLDDTERAYGSIDALISLPSLRVSGQELLEAYLERFKTATKNSADDISLSEMFSSRAVRRDAGDSQPLEDRPFNSLPIPVDAAIAGKGLTLYDAIDDLVWNLLTDTEAYLAEIGDVFAFEVQNHTGYSGLGVSIPATWYADRYLESSIPEAKEMNKRKAAIAAQVDHLDSVQERIMNYQSPAHSGTLDAGVLVTKVTEFFQQTAEYEGSLKQDESQSNGHLSQRTQQAMEELSSLTKRVTEKLNGEPFSSSCRKLAQLTP